ncbi:GNAT family N-acetyltransferase [Adhaeribacter swui]|uniref:GNAT family N-acetyltransferase n=1 Tax=Adhaeribacter swui TaxID=2086471 RepID=A0A7G7G464_9BACT|nr:GNAT family N-acetyltransferase [Adhaeribacter swui]QNF31948.1 GNAT family N-acetyltransferase [Adhaeribacter swui]
MIELRPAEFLDYSAIALLHAASWQKTYRGIYSDKFLDEKVEKDRLELWYHRLNSPAIGQQITIASQDNTMVGFSCIYLDDDLTYGTLLDNLHVAANYQKSGIGKLLVKNCAKLILENSKNPTMYLWVFEANQNARRVYERLGGVNMQIIEKQNEDGTKAIICRYVWEDVTSLI